MTSNSTTICFAIIGFALFLNLSVLVTDDPVPEPEIGDSREFAESKFIRLTRYHITGTITYEGNDSYLIRAEGADKDNNLRITINGSTGGDVITSIRNPHKQFTRNVNYDRAAVGWFERGAVI